MSDYVIQIQFWDSVLGLGYSACTCTALTCTPQIYAIFTRVWAIAAAMVTTADVLVVGAGLGGCAAALAAARKGHIVVLTEPTDWIGGQLTSQGVPPDEHPWIEECGCSKSYRALRNAMRAECRERYPLAAKAAADPRLNPGQAWVSKLSCEPRVSLAALEKLLRPFIASGTVRLLLEHDVVRAATANDTITSATFCSRNKGELVEVVAKFVVDATELGDVLHLAEVEHVTGAESKAETGEPHAPATPAPRNTQAITMCFAVDHCAGEDHTIERPEEYDFWQSFEPTLTPPWPGKLLDLRYSQPVTLAPVKPLFEPHNDTLDPNRPNLWSYRRILARRLMDESSSSSSSSGAGSNDIVLINWPQNDWWLQDLCLATPQERLSYIRSARQLSLSLLYWLQTEGGLPGLRPRGDVMGTCDGVAKAPYIREARRIVAKFTVTESHLSPACGARSRAVEFWDSVGLGYYRIDLHPSVGGDNYIDIGCLPFQIPLGALVPVRVRNLLPAAKNIGTTHITNGCFRLHPVEWAIGEAAGALAAFCLDHTSRQGGGDCTPQEVHADASMVAAFQRVLADDGVELRWPEVVHEEALAMYLENPMVGDQLREQQQQKRKSREAKL